MDDSLILNIVKINLQISVDSLDEYILRQIEFAKGEIRRIGIVLDAESNEDVELVAMYATWIYRSKKDDEKMPRILEWHLNQRLFSQKAVQ